MNKIIALISSTFPSLGKYKRVFKAWLDSVRPEQTSYSQFKDDVAILKELEKLELIDGVYVDVGANHPSSISNTYKLYRKGYRGIIIEPNKELIDLHKKFRPKDIQIAVGCGEQNQIMKFNYSKTPVLSSFVSEEVRDVWKTEYLPVYTLDTIVSSLSVQRVFFLSIDVEGWDYEVLQGAKETLEKTYLVCVEANNELEANKIKSFFNENNFEFLFDNNCNLVFKNSSI